ncbi:MAG: hypothetical protein K2X93_17260, partial [Candidatus Obscuribacterales bacterium]|nr:hypothetical protein [Candidatus Obscuribacterales bacterium]
MPARKPVVVNAAGDTEEIQSGDTVALAAGDIPNLNASKITAGQLAVARGGTGQDFSAQPAGRVPYFTGTGVFGTFQSG